MYTTSRKLCNLRKVTVNVWQNTDTLKYTDTVLDPESREGDMRLPTLCPVS